MYQQNINLCAAVLPGFTFSEMIDVASSAGFSGIEMRVHDDGHKNLVELEKEGAFIARRLEKAQLNVPVLNSYCAVDDDAVVDRLLKCCQEMNIPKVRLVLPRSCQASVSRQANISELLPSYSSVQEPFFLMKSLRHTLRTLEKKALKYGVKVLLELHWGTVMSSFSSAYFLLADIDPELVSITFDPANMMVEGKEDWEFGLKLIQPHLDNVHVKNMSWFVANKQWQWAWSSLTEGMVDWYELTQLLTTQKYSGDYAVEDFLVPQDSLVAAVDYLRIVREEFAGILSLSQLAAALEQTKPNVVQLNSKAA